MSTKSTKALLVSLAEKGRFVLVGITNTGVDFILLNLLVTFFALPLYGANLISAFVAMCISFLLNKTFVFNEKGKATVKEFFTFIGVTLLSIWGVQTLVIFLITQQFPQPLFTIADAVHDNGLTSSFSVEFIRNNLAKIVATGASLVWNYLFYKYVVFSKPNKKVTAHEDRP